jgi:hypothetical protein
MKKLVLITIALVALQATAQDQKREHHREGGNEKMGFMKSLTPEEISDLQTKKMTLHLDLTEAQQAKVKILSLEEAKLRKAKMNEHQKRMEQKDAEKPSKDEQLKMLNGKLDHQIEVKQKMKAILNANQFEKWEKTQEKRHAQKGKKRRMMKHHKKQ